MHILIVTPYYPPVTSTLSTMMQECAERLLAKGHSVTIITLWLPHKLSEGSKECEAFSVENGVNVIRVRNGILNHKSYFIRGIAQLMLPFFFWRNIKKYIKVKIDAVMVYTPPLSFAKIGKKVKKVYGAKYLLNIQDIFPQNAIDLGIMKNRLTIKLFESIEKKAYAGADKMTSHTESSRELLIKQKNIPANKIYHVPNWIDTTPFVTAKRTGNFRSKYGLDDKLVFLFAGVMGPSQGLELIVGVAKKVEKTSNKITFLMVGDGTEKRRIERLALERGVGNVLFKPLVSLDEYPSLVKEADVGVLCLSSKNKTPVVPAKVLGYMASSIPVVAFLNKESDGHSLIEQAKCGYSACSNDFNESVRVVEKIYCQRDKFSEWGQNGLEHVTKHFSVDACTDQIERYLQ